MKLNSIKFFSMCIVLFFGALVSCEDESSTEDLVGSQNYVSFENNRTALISTGETVVVDAKVFASQVSSVDRTLELVLITAPVTATSPDRVTTTADPAVFSMPASVTIPAGSKQASFPVTILGSGLGSTGKTIVIGIVPQEGLMVATTYAGTQDAGNFATASKRLVITAKEVCNANPLRVQIYTDRYGSETSWDLFNSNDLENPIASGGPFTDQTTNNAFKKPDVDLCLESGSYTFVVYDSYGDGMNSGTGAGYYRLVTMNSDFSTEILEIAKNGTFGAFDIVEFTLP